MINKNPINLKKGDSIIFINHFSTFTHGYLTILGNFSLILDNLEGTVYSCFITQRFQNNGVEMDRPDCKGYERGGIELPWGGITRSLIILI